MIRYVFLIALMISVVGCADIETKVSFQDGETKSFQGGEMKSFTFAKQAGSTSILESDIQKAFVSAFKSSSLYELLRSFRASPNHDELTHRGVQVKQVANGIEVAHLNNYGSLVNSRKATYALAISETPSNYHVQMTCPTDFDDFRSLGMQPHFSTEKVVKNFVAICDNASPVVKKVEYVKGEIDSRFSSDDVFANFSRVLRENNGYSNEEVKAFDIEKASIFELTTEHLDTTLAVSVFPYRGGSKTIYSFMYPFTANSQGETTYNHNVVRRVKQRIEEIVRD